MTVREFVILVVPFIKKSLITALLLSLVIFIVSYKLPSKFVASGTIYVKRAVEENKPAYFTYEGYYSGLTAEKYTDTVVGFLKSVDIRKETLLVLGLPISQKYISDLERMVLVKKAGPALVSVSVSTKNEDLSLKVWNALSGRVVQKSLELNKDGDSLLSLSVVSEKPIVVEKKVNLFAVFIFSLVSIFSACLFLLSFKKYLKN